MGRESGGTCVTFQSLVQPEVRGSAGTWPRAGKGGWLLEPCPVLPGSQVMLADTDLQDPALLLPRKGPRAAPAAS